jgi:ferredoxin-NADP reductase
VISIVKTALLTTDRPIVLVYANRDRDSVIFAAELERLAADHADRFSLHHHLDDDRGFLDAAACATLVGDRAHADFYICGPGPYMDVVEAALATLDVPREHVFIERFVTPETVVGEDAASDDASSTVVAGAGAGAGAATVSLTIRLDGHTHTLDHTAGDTILQAARRGGLDPPFSCEMGNCATCMAHLDAGAATMRANNALTADEVDTGWVLTCQAMPTTAEVVVDYDA